MSVFSNKLYEAEEIIKIVSNALLNAKYNITQLELSAIISLEEELRIIISMIENNELKVRFDDQYLMKAKTALKNALKKLEKGFKGEISEDLKLVDSSKFIQKKSRYNKVKEFLAETTEKRRTKNMQKKLYYKIIEIKAQIDNQIYYKNIRLNFPTLIIEYSNLLGKSGNLASKIKSDIDKIIYKFENFLNSILNTTEKFYGRIAKENGHEIIKKLSTNLREEISTIRANLKDILTNTGEGIKYVLTFEKTTDLFFEAVKNASKEYLKEIQEQQKRAA